MGRSAVAVIGANYGDEGKGLVTDYLADENSIVVRFNGGAQAGHTVVTPDGRRHVFSHVGAGTFKGASTFLSKYFVINPMIFKKEMLELKALGQNPQIYVDRDCMVTTPYDVFLNEELERFRGINRHGSCGVGFGTTIETNILTNGMNTIDELCFTNGRYHSCSLAKLNYIENTIYGLIKGYNLPVFEEKWDYIKSVKPIYINLLDEFCNYVDFNTKSYRHSSGGLHYEFNFGPICNFIFEGAQGLLLDQNHKNFPYVTRSNTGLTNVIKLCRRMDIDTLTAMFVTRCYLTRHGAGPMEMDEIPSEKIKAMGIVDQTNSPNEFQGTLRYAPIDYNDLGNRMLGEIEYFNRQIDLKYGLAVTHLDEMDAFSKYNIGCYTDIYCYADVCTSADDRYVGLMEVNGPTHFDVHFSVKPNAYFPTLLL